MAAGDGILPPLSAAAWGAEFEKYQHIRNIGCSTPA